MVPGIQDMLKGHDAQNITMWVPVIAEDMKRFSCIFWKTEKAQKLKN